MLKLTLLGHWHHLSDAPLEQALKVRVGFLVFCGFDLGEALPDHTTICRFRNRLVAAKLEGEQGLLWLPGVCDCRYRRWVRRHDADAAGQLVGVQAVQEGDAPPARGRRWRAGG